MCKVLMWSFRRFSGGRGSGCGWPPGCRSPARSPARSATGPLAELLGQRDEDPLGAADVTEPVAILVLRHLSNEFRAMGSQAGDRGIDVVDDEHDAMHAKRVVRSRRLGADRRGGQVLRQLKP